jgi:hypothetical protein
MTTIAEYSLLATGGYVRTLSNQAPLPPGWEPYGEVAFERKWGHSPFLPAMT